MVSVMRTEQEWIRYCVRNIKGGYISMSDNNPAGFYDASLVLLKQIQSLTSLHGKRILDIGCGLGRLPMGLDGEEIPFLSYVGLDVLPYHIRYCTEAFREDGRFEFYHLPVQNKRYAPKQDGSLASVDFTKYGEFDLVVANSVFTHLGPLANAKAYMRQIRRVLGASTEFYCTFLTVPPHTAVRYDCKRTIYRIEDVRALFVDNGLMVDSFRDGDTTEGGNQLRVLLKNV